MSNSPDGNTSRLQSFAEQFVTSTRRYLFVRPKDGGLILRPNKVHHLDRQHRMAFGQADKRMDESHPLIR